MPDDLHVRQAWAKRQGNPDWLWPEVGPDAWRKVNGEIASVIAAAIRGNGRATLSGDPLSLQLAGYISGVGPMLGHWLEKGIVSTSRTEIAELFALQLNHNRRRMASVLEKSENLLGQLADRGIEAVVLKGAHTATAYFPEPGARPMSDIDVLVRPADVSATGTILAAEGFECEKTAARESSWRHSESPRAPASVFMLGANDPWTIDLHHSLDLSMSAAAPLAEVDRAEPMNSTRRWRSNRPGLALGQPLLLLHLVVHAGSGRHNLSLLRLLELCLVIWKDRAARTLEWGAFLDVAACTGSLGYAYPALAMAEKLLPGTVPEGVLSECAAYAPARVVRYVDRLEPGSAQRLGSRPLSEHFIWTRRWSGWLRPLARRVAVDMRHAWRG